MVVEGVEPILVAAERDVSRPMLTEQLRDEIDLYAWCGAQQRFGSTAVIAWETAVTGAPQREPGEDIQMWTLPAEAVERARRGEVGSAPYALVLFLADPHLRARGFL